MDNVEKLVISIIIAVAGYVFLSLHWRASLKEPLVSQYNGKFISVATILFIIAYYALGLFLADLFKIPCHFRVVAGVVFYGGAIYLYQIKTNTNIFDTYWLKPVLIFFIVATFVVGSYRTYTNESCSTHSQDNSSRLIM